MPRIFLSTAEPSAELHASRLAEEISALSPGMVIDAAGSGVLAGAGANIVVDMSGKAVMGVWEALSYISFYRRAAESILAALARNAYDALVVVDAPSFHLRLARRAHARWPGLPILYYIAPKLWAWKKWRAGNLRRDIAKTLCIFPFEEEFFRTMGVNAAYVGNPTLDQVRGLDGAALAGRFGVSGARRHSEPERGLLAIFPGSRESEVRRLWPVMLRAAVMLRERFPDLKAAVAVAPGWSRERLASFAEADDGVMFVEGSSQELLAASSVVMAKSGTTTLEAGLMGKPMAVCYAVHPVSFLVARSMVRLPYVSLPNILAGGGIVREFLQGEATAENLAGEIGRILADRRYYRRMRTRLMALRRTFGDERGARRAAREVMAFVGGGD